nr:uncharacterized protein LOC109160563 [Ipomoea trifida]
MITMASLLFSTPSVSLWECNSFRVLTKNSASSTVRIGGLSSAPTLNSRIACARRNVCRWSSLSGAESSEEEDPDDSIDDLRVPIHWLEPSKALEESEWLRVALKKWLDDEYCPEDTNVEISKVASSSFYRSLMEKQLDIGEILLTMARDLESISYQESFHGAFSSANAAVNLILQRVEQE